jgi:hypothetical protein
VPGRTQSALYADLDLELSWSEDDLPQVERTKHVHGLHPYLGKFIPQLVEVFLDRYFARGGVIYDPFVGSGTTLVEANVLGSPGIGCDISAFNCLLARVKTARYSLGELEVDLRGALEGSRRSAHRSRRRRTQWLETWFSGRARDELLGYRAEVERLKPAHADVGRVVLSRAARSARLTTHYDLDFPRRPTTAPYYCHKHKRTCRPVDEAQKFLARYTDDTLRRIREFAALRTERPVHLLHADSRSVDLPSRAAGVITSPPYPGLIDYHEQHRYAYELLGLEDRRADELGAGVAGRTRAALVAYVEGMAEVFRNAAAQLERDGRVVIVVNDSQDLYPGILERAGLTLDDRITRHVNRRTGRRAGEFYEDVLVCRPA